MENFPLTMTSTTGARAGGCEWSGERDDSQVVGEGAEAARHGAQSSPGAVSTAVPVAAARGCAHGRSGRCLSRGAAHAQAENEDPDGKRGHHRGCFLIIIYVVAHQLRRPTRSHGSFIPRSFFLECFGVVIIFLRVQSAGELTDRKVAASLFIGACRG